MFSVPSLHLILLLAFWWGSLKPMSVDALSPHRTWPTNHHAVFDTLHEGRAANMTKFPAEHVTLPLDHFGRDNRTFENRYWVVDEDYQPGGPVFIFDNGEKDAEMGVEAFYNGLSGRRDFVGSFNGISILWEHRYYGKSAPFEVNEDTTAADMAYLDVKQALLDVVMFASNFTSDKFPSVDLTPASTPWVFLGGSYPGMRAAWMREHYPETIFASYASSAPMQFTDPLVSYYEPIYRGLNAYGYGNCSKDLHAAIMHIDAHMDDPAASDAWKNQYLSLVSKGQSPDPFFTNLTNSDFFNILANTFGDWQYRGPRGAVGRFCDWMETEPHGNETSVAGAAGWEPSKGVDFVIQKWLSSPLLENYYIDTGKANKADKRCQATSKSQGAEDPSSEECHLMRLAKSRRVAWNWQLCTQLGYHQIANRGPHQLVSSTHTAANFRQTCLDNFPDAAALFPGWPFVGGANPHLGGWDLRPSNTYWTGGEFDPWRSMSPLSSELWAPRPLVSQAVPDCNVSTGPDEVFGYVMGKAEHGYDFRAGDGDAVVARKYFTDALREWLKCFEPGMRA